MQKDFYKMSDKEAIKELRSNKNGLTDSEAKKRLSIYGKNELQEMERKPPFILFLEQFKNILILILIFVTIISLFFGEVLEGIVIIIIIFLFAGIGYYQERKAEKAIESLKKLSTPRADVLRDSKIKEIDATELVPGDVIILEVGKKVPADARIIEYMNLKVDESILTGESVPVKKENAIIEKTTMLAERTNMIFSGTTIAYGRCRAVVTATGMRTEVGKIADVLQEEQEPTILQKRLEKLGKELGLIIVVICAFIFALRLWQGYAIFETFQTAITLAVAAIPEGLPAIVAISLAIGVQKMAKRNAIVRRLMSVETLGCTTVICSDKTGTLTVNQMTAKRLYVNGKFIDITGEGYTPEGEFLYRGQKYNLDNDAELLLRTGLLCNDAEIVDSAEIGDPTEAALVVAALKGIEDVRSKHKRIDEIPFDSDRKMMTTINTIDGKKVSSTKGAPEVVVERCKYILKNGSVKRITKEDKNKILKANDGMTKNALRVLGFAYRELPSKYRKENAEKDMIFIGMIGSIDPPRKEAKESITKCRQAGVRVVMITGDHRNTAVAIADEVGFYGEKVVTGEEMDDMNDDELYKISKTANIYARVSPKHKIRIINALKKRGNVVAMIGDGVNDAPALKKSNIAVAVGTGTDVAKDVSDMILIDDNFQTIVSAVEEGRGIYDNIKRAINYLLSCNFGEILTILIATLVNLPTPLLPLQILWMNLVTDSMPALALGTSRADPDVMKRKPRAKNEKILNIQSLRFIGFIGIIMSVGTVFIFMNFLDMGFVKASTMAFTALIVIQMVIALISRSEHYPFLRTGIKNNKKLIGAIGISILLQLMIIYTPFFNTIFGTTPLNFIEWGIIIVFAAIVFAIFETIKIFNKEFF